MAAISVKEHVIHRLQVEVERAQAPVSFRVIYSHSSRDREALKKALEELIEDGLVGVAPTPPGVVGRPTNYFYLKNVWVPDPEASPVDRHNRLVPTAEPSPYDEESLEFTDLKEGGLADFDFDAEVSDLFTTLGPRIVRYIETRKHVSDPAQLFDFFASDVIPRHRVDQVFNRLFSDAYHEFYTEWGIVLSKTVRKDGARDRRIAGGTGETFARRGEAITEGKAERMAQGQARREELTRRLFGDHIGEADIQSYLAFPTPSDDLPEMDHFVAVYQSLG